MLKKQMSLKPNSKENLTKGEDAYICIYYICLYLGHNLGKLWACASNIYSLQKFILAK